MPYIGVLREYNYPDILGVRMWLIEGFEDYLIFYRPAGKWVEIIRVLHARRDIESMFRGG